MKFAGGNIRIDFMNANKTKQTSGQVYAELLCDFMFKRLFGSEENKDVLRYVFLEVGRFRKCTQIKNTALDKVS